MHELSLAAAVVEIACRHAGGRRVTKVGLKVGHLRQVVPAALAFSFELVAQGTVAEGAELEQKIVPARALCRACAVESPLRAFPLQCEACGGVDLQFVAGDELDVEYLELDEGEVSDV
jgi:hydrogenase nickel incorporation protein HypA/HybF